MNTTQFIPQIPKTVKARFSGYHITLSGPCTDVEQAANLLLNYGIASAEEESSEAGVGGRRVVLTFYRKKLKETVRNIAEMGYFPARKVQTLRRKRDGRKNSSIINYWHGLENYKTARLANLLQVLSEVTEEIGERAEVVEGRKGRGLNEILA